jgi:hypothetical protein
LGAEKNAGEDAGATFGFPGPGEIVSIEVSVLRNSYRGDAMPVANKELEAFGALQRQLAQGVMSAVLSVVQQPWKELYLDVRARPGQIAHKSKLRVVLVSGGVISVAPPAAIAGVIADILQMRHLFEQPWSGMKLTITCAGECNVHFDFDPKCADDPAFFKD